MKNCLQELWKDVIPDSGPCPQPDVKKVRRRVDAALDGSRRTLHLRRTLKLAALCAAALVLLTGAAAVVTEVAWPEHNVLSAFFYGDTTSWEHMVNTQPVSVSDDNYTLTLTSSVADKSTLFYTFTVQAHSDEAWDALQNWEGLWADLWSFRFHGSLSLGGGYGDPIDPETRTMSLGVAAGWTLIPCSGVRLELMEKGVWLNFTFTPVSDLKLNINADGQAKSRRHVPDYAEGTVTLKRLTLSPFTVQAEYTTESTDIFPVLYFLWGDGTYSEVEPILGGDGHGSGHGVEGGAWQFTKSCSFRSVQDLSTLEAVVFGGMAYPVDHGEPYEVDLSALTMREMES